MARIMNEAAQAAKELKKELQTRWPGVKFSVKSEVYSGGDSINVSWNFGPTESEVNRLAKTRQQGHFDSMNDIYEYDNDRLTVNATGDIEPLKGAKYVFCRREYRLPAEKESYDTTSFNKAMHMAICSAFGVNYEGGRTQLTKNGYGPDNEASTATYRIVQKLSFPSDNIEFIALRSTGKDCGMWEDLYTVEFKDLNVKEQTTAIAIDRVANARTAAHQELTASIDNIEFINYSEKSFIVIGDTYAIKEILKLHGGRFNAFLTHPINQTKVKGWVFALNRKDELINALSTIKH